MKHFTEVILKSKRENLDDIMFLENQIFPVDPFSRRTWQLFVDKGWAFCLYIKGVPVGCGSIILNTFPNGIKKGRIYSVGVLDKYRGKGIASRLIQYMENQMGDVDYITLETHKHHKSVIRLYEKLGYEITEPCLKDYYSDGDGVRMRKNVYKHLPDIVYKTIPQKEMRYRDAGDWFDTKKGWQIRVPELMNIDYEFMIFIHESIERYLVHKMGLSVTYVDKWIAENLKDDYKQGAMTKGSPHRKYHIFATQIEKQICAHLGISWMKYCKEVDGYVDKLYERK